MNETSDNSNPLVRWQYELRTRFHDDCWVTCTRKKILATGVHDPEAEDDWIVPVHSPVSR